MFAGRLEKSKGIEFCIRTFLDFKKKTDSKTELWIAGDSSDIEYVKYLKKMAASSDIKFIGMRKDILDLMYKAKALIVPSEHEGFGFITTEAMFNGALVIGRNNSGTKEQMDNGLKMTGNEIALRFENENQLLERLMEVNNNGIDGYRDMIIRSQQVVSKLYSSEEHVQQVVNLYTKILQQ